MAKRKVQSKPAEGSNTYARLRPKLDRTPGKTAVEKVDNLHAIALENQARTTGPADEIDIHTARNTSKDSETRKRAVRVEERRVKHTVSNNATSPLKKAPVANGGKK